MKNTILFLIMASFAFADDAPKPPIMPDAQKVQILQAILAVREIEVTEKQVADEKKRRVDAAQELLKAAQKPGFALGMDLVYVATPKAVESKPEAK